MKEFIEKLNEKLKYLLNNFGEHCEEWGSDKEGDCHRKSCSDCVLTHAIEIVNELAEGYNNDFCEWKMFKANARLRHKNCMFVEDTVDPWKFNFCPYCGKKIKVVE